MRLLSSRRLDCPGSYLGQQLEGTEYKNAVDFLCSHVEEVSPSALLDYAAVARVFSEKVAIRYGIYRLRLLLTYGAVLFLGGAGDDPQEARHGERQSCILGA